MRQFIWSLCFELITDIDPDNPQRDSGTRKPTRLAKLIERICLGKPPQ